MEENNENNVNNEEVIDNVEEISVEGNDTIKIANEAVATYAGIAVSDDKNAKIDVSIIVEYGARIPDVAYEIQSRVKGSVENMTGLKVLEVNVHVQGVHAKSEKDNKQEDEVVENTQEEEKTETNE